MPIVTLETSTPLRDGRQSDRALAVRRGVCRHFLELGITFISELTLPNGRRADLIGIDRKGGIIIIEIKSSVEDFRADNKWTEYHGFCDRYYFATLPDVPSEIFPETEGLILADAYGCDFLREANLVKIPAATRKSLTIRMARAASQRLERVLDHCIGTNTDLPDQLEQITGD